MRGELDHNVERVISALLGPTKSENVRLVASRDAPRRAYVTAFLDPGFDKRRADSGIETHLRPPCASRSRQESPDNLDGGINVRHHRHGITKHTTKLSPRQEPLATRPDMGVGLSSVQG